MVVKVIERKVLWWIFKFDVICIWVLKVIGSRGFICPHMVKAMDVAMVRTRWCYTIRI